MENEQECVMDDYNENGTNVEDTSDKNVKNEGVPQETKNMEEVNIVTSDAEIPPEKFDPSSSKLKRIFCLNILAWLRREVHECSEHENTHQGTLFFQFFQYYSNIFLNI